MGANARLLVEIAASIGTFKEDMGRAAAIAEANGKRIESAFKGLESTVAAALKGFAAGLIGAFSVSALIDYAKETIGLAAALDDLSDATGSTVENLSKLRNQAAISGKDFATFEQIVLKLAAGMGRADDETSRTNKALAFLGITTKDPAQALQEIAVKLSQYADGAGKAAIAQDLFGKTGPAFVAVLKDIANLQDVAATTTAKQAAEAERLEQSWRRLSVESTTLKNAILSEIVPALANLVERFLLARQAGEGMFAAFLRAGTNIETVKEQIAAAGDELTRLKAKAAANNFAGLNIRKLLPDAFLITDEDVRKQEAKLKALQKIFAQSLGNLDFLNKDRRPTLDYKLPSAPKADVMSEAERYLRNLEDQLQRTKELSVAEAVLADIERGRLKLSGGVTLDALLAIARQIDKAKEEKAAREALVKQMEEEARIRERISQANTRELQAATAETGKLAESNAALKDEIALVGADAKKRDELTQARLDSTIALKEEQAAMLANAGPGSEALISSLEDQIRLLKERKGLVAQKGIAEALLADANKIKEINDIFVNSFADAASAVATHTKSIGEAFRDMERQIVASISRIAAQNIADAIFGKSGATGGDIGGTIAKLFGLIGGGGGGSTASSVLPQLIDTIGGFAAGTDYAPGGLSVVGERGPEVVNLPRGAQVIPNSELNARRAGRASIHMTVNVLPGASTKSANQAAMQAGLAVQRALAKNA